MRVLHISDDPLPDARVEKMTHLSKKRGWETFFAGPGFGSFALNEKVFGSLHYVPWNRYVRLGFQPFLQRTKKKLRRIIEKLKPDMVHAHNVFAAKMVCDLGYPFVFDDHELISLEKKSDIEWERSNLFDRIIGKYEVRKWSQWEREASSKAPVITVSSSIAEYYERLGAKVFVVPNYPSFFEISNAQFSINKNKPFTAVYLGNDVSTLRRPHRDTKGIVDIFRETGLRFVVMGDKKLSSSGTIVSKGYIPHLNLYNIMSKCHVGLLPWKKHWFHRYANPNKPYIYAHSSMVVVVTSSLHNVVKAFRGKCQTIENYSDLKDLLLELSHNMDGILEEGEKVREYALKNFIFEKYEDEVMEAYENA